MVMVENIKDISVNHQPVKIQRQESQDSLIDHKDLKGILFLGVKGDIDIEIADDESKVDFLA